jgi:hypothetical protein
MLYFVVTTVILGFLGAFAWSCRVKDKSKPKVVEVYLGCVVCGCWTSHITCSECVTWAEVVICHYEKRLPSFQLAIREHTRLINAAGW